MQEEHLASKGVNPHAGILAAERMAALATAMNAMAGEDERITRKEMYFAVANVVRLRSTCKRGKVGAVIVKDRRIIAMGYNGAPPGMPHCFEIGCDVQENIHVLGCQRAIHAEANAIAVAAQFGIAVQGAVMYCTHGPCSKCAQLILGAGLAALHYRTPYRLPEGAELLTEAVANRNSTFKELSQDEQ